jgi:hypothetical protein
MLCRRWSFLKIFLETIFHLYSHRWNVVLQMVLSVFSQIWYANDMNWSDVWIKMLLILLVCVSITKLFGAGSWCSTNYLRNKLCHNGMFRQYNTLQNVMLNSTSLLRLQKGINVDVQYYTCHGDLPPSW